MTKHIFTTLVLTLAVGMTWAADVFKYEGINYRVIEGTDECAVVQYDDINDRYAAPLVNIPSQVTYQDKAYLVTEVGDAAFQWCGEIKTIVLPQSLKHIRKQAFQGCSGLATFSIPDNVESIGSSSFSGCIGLSRIVLPQKLTVIEENTFIGCSNLRSVHIGPNVTQVKTQAFMACELITTITCLAKEPPTVADEKAFDGIDRNPSLYVWVESVSAYRSAFGWKRFYQGLNRSNASAHDQLKTPELKWVKGHPQFVGEKTGLSSIYVKAISEPDFSEPIVVESGEEVKLPFVIEYQAKDIFHQTQAESNVVVQALYLTPDDLLGDLNQDGTVNHKDARQLAEEIIGK